MLLRLKFKYKILILYNLNHKPNRYKKINKATIKQFI